MLDREVQIKLTFDEGECILLACALSNAIVMGSFTREGMRAVLKSLMRQYAFSVMRSGDAERKEG
jgi:hypothetical protein